MKRSRKYELWIDVVKCLAIGGVMLQHVNGTLYTDQRVAVSVFWVVAAFVIIGGYNAMSSWKQNKKVSMANRLAKILVPYIICTCIYVIWENQFLSAEIVWQKAIHFNAAGPLYFVAVYIQLVVISPFLIGCINWAEEKSRLIRHTFLLSMVWGISYLSVHYTDILQIGLGGGKLFSGFWLIFWYGGMIFSVKKRDWGVKQKKALSVVLLFLCLLWEYIFVFRDFNDIFRKRYGNMYHMTTAQLTWWNALEAFLIVFLIKEAIELLETRQIKVAAIFLKPICYIGKNSLYIFMYHILFRDIFYMYFSYGNIWTRRILCFVFMTGGSLLTCYLMRVFKQMIIEMIERTKVQRTIMK